MYVEDNEPPQPTPAAVANGWPRAFWASIGALILLLLLVCVALVLIAAAWA
jgi:hypothetical protein